ncbi:importin-4-like isoform X2 [Sitodiplosis mosellana]|uniref:importin-4-like isoform X2 n=1 Tax=Sitodiplosis mosellana TaxID=263140 RepID=UPI00244408B3|nr:importin-4-like isoform X2 [Sitodiplosis mosellana]
MRSLLLFFRLTQATADLQEAFKRPEAISALCDVIVSSPEVQHRQYAAVLLTKRLGKLRNWQQVPTDHQEIMKQGMLNALVNEKEKPVRNAIAQFVGTLIKHDSHSPAGTYTLQVLKFVFDHCASENVAQREVGTSIFSTLTATAPDQFIPHIDTICEMFTSALLAAEQCENMATPVISNVLLGMCNLVPFILGHNNAEATYQKAIPHIVKALATFAVHDADQFMKSFDVLENLCDYTPTLLNGSLKTLIDFCLGVSNNEQLEDSVRVRAVSYIGWLVRLKKKAIIKQKLVEPIVQVVFKLMATAPEEGDDEDEEEYFAEESSPKTSATQTMNELALHIPPEKLIPPLLALLEPALQANDPLYKKAAYLSIAVIAEGCSEAICNKYLRVLLDCVKNGISDPNPIVRNAAFFSLGQFAEFLQPEISKYANEILPILFEFLQSLCNEIRNGQPEPKSIERMFYALEVFCENLEDEIIPHLPALLERLFETLNPANSVKLRDLALGAVGAVAQAAKSNMLPYFPQLIEGLKAYLVKTDNEDILELRPRAIDTLATLARTIGKENFMPLANDTMNFALTLLSEANNEEPELKTSLYNLLSALSEVVNAEMAPFLPKIVETMLDSVKSSEGLVPQFKGDKNGDGETDEEIDLELSDDEDDEDDENLFYSVDNAYWDEKEEAILALKLLAEYTGPAFAQYLQPCFESIYKQLDHVNIRKSATEALAQFTVSLFNLNNIDGAKNAVSIIVPKFAEELKNDEDIHTAMAVFEAYSVILNTMKSQALFNEDIKNHIFSCIHDVLASKVACQFNDNTGDEENDDSEYLVALRELAGEVLPKLGHSLQPQEFEMYFSRALPLLLEKLEKSRNNEDLNSERSLVYGTLSECFSALQQCTANWFDTLLPLYLAGVQDEYEEARQNAVFGLGELVLFSGEKAYAQFPQVLQALSQIVAVEKEEGVLDNICGALARMITSNSTLVPLDHVLPVFVQKIPLRKDFHENKAVFKAFHVLLAQGSEAFLKTLDRVIVVGLHVLGENEYKDDETRNILADFLRDSRQRYPDIFNQIVVNNAQQAQYASLLN